MLHYFRMCLTMLSCSFSSSKCSSAAVSGRGCRSGPIPRQQHLPPNCILAHLGQYRLLYCLLQAQLPHSLENSASFHFEVEVEEASGLRSASTAEYCCSEQMPELPSYLSAATYVASEEPCSGLEEPSMAGDCFRLQTLDGGACTSIG